MLTSSERTVPRLLLDQRVPMRDALTLSADIYLPPAGSGPWPALLVRTPYDNSRELLVKPAVSFARHEYAVVVQDVRGRYDSDGVWTPWVNEGSDGYDTIAWIGQQPWSNGRVGMFGASYEGFAQWAAAKERPPHLSALVSTVAAGRWLEGLIYQFGVPLLNELSWLNTVGGRTQQPSRLGGVEGLPDWPRILQHRPLREMDGALGRTNTVWREWFEHATFDPYVQQLSLVGHFAELDLPVLHITGWFDFEQWSVFHFWHGMTRQSAAADRQWLLVGPWDHMGAIRPRPAYGGRTFGSEALLDMNALHLRFFDRWLNDVTNGADSDPRVRLFTMGLNVWRDEDEWPPTDTIGTAFYLHSAGSANTLAGNGALDQRTPDQGAPSDEYVYDPDNPTPSMPDLGLFPAHEQPLDRRWQLRRDDALVYTSLPVADDLEMTGHPVFVLFAASDCPDTDWHVALFDVFPNGRSEQLATGCLRAAYRAGTHTSPSAIEPDQVYEYRIELSAISNVWLTGHRVRVAVASARFPDYARNPNTNAPPGEDANWRIARNRVFHTTDYPSHLLAPIRRRTSEP